MLRPVGGGKAQGVDPDGSTVEQLVAATHEEPTLVSPVDVAVEDRLLQPPASVLHLTAAIHRTTRVGRVDQIDHLRRHVQDGDADRGKGLLERSAERSPAGAVDANVDVVDKELDQCVQVSSIDCKGVTRDELANLLTGEEALDVPRLGHPRTVGGLAFSWQRRRPVGRQPRPQV